MFKVNNSVTIVDFEYVNPANIYLFRVNNRNTRKRGKICSKLTITRSWLPLRRLRAKSPPVSEPRISQGHVIKGPCDIIGRSPSREAIILPSLVAIDTLVIEI